MSSQTSTSAPSQTAVAINNRLRKQLSSRIKRACRDEQFYTLLEPWGCGAFDGGCVMTAMALREVFGVGQYIIALGYSTLSAQQPPRIGRQHALLLINDHLLDGDGVSTRRILRWRWRRWEHTIITGFEPVMDFQVMIDQGTPYNPTIVRRMAAFFHEQLPLDDLS
jgi:hypothetical protein